MFRKLRKNGGQSATEYMLIVAVIVLGLVAGASYIVPQFKAGVQSLSGRITSWLSNDIEFQK